MPAPTLTLPRALPAAGVIILLAALAVIGPATTATAVDDVTWGAMPADNDHGGGRANFAYDAAPGDVIDDGFVITNFGATARTFDVYAADAVTTATGALDLLPAQSPSTDVGAWVHLAQDHVEVAPGQSMLVPFRITIPTDASPGDHTGGVVSALVSQRDGDGIDVERRLGSRVQIRVNGSLKPRLSIQRATLTYSMTQDPFGTSEASVDYTVVNTGNARLRGTQRVTVTGPFGAFSASAAGADLPDLLPGSSYDVHVVVPGVRPSGHLTATISIDPLLVPEDSSKAVPPVTSHVAAWAVPWLPAAFLVLLVLVIGFAVQRAVSRRRTRPDAGDASGPAVGAEDQRGEAPVENGPARV
jgi:hypothetical protein